MKRLKAHKLRQSFWLVPCFVFILALALRLWHLGKQSFWMDEGFSVWMSSHSLGEIFKILETDQHPPLFYWFLHVVMGYGREEAFLRVSFAVFGAINTALIYFITWKGLDRRSAFLAATLWGTSFLALFSETQARMYPMANCFSLLATLLFIDTFHKPSPWKWAAYVAAGALGLYTHYYSGLVLCAHIVFLLTQRRWKIAGLLIGVFFIFFSPWISMLAAQFHNIQLGHVNLFPAKKLFSIFSLLLGSHYWLQGGWRDFAANCAGLGIAVLACAILWRSGVKESRLFVYLFGIPFLGIVAIAALTNEHVFYLRHMDLLAPYFYMIASSALSKVKFGIRGTVVAAFLVINVWMWKLFVMSPEYERQNFRAASRFVQARLAIGDVVFFGNFMSIFPLWYYLPRQVEIQYFPEKYMFALIPRNDRNVFWIPVNGETQVSYLTQVIRASKRQWLILCQEKLVDPPEKIPHFFFHSGKPILSERFLSLDNEQNIDVYLFNLIH